MPQKVKLLFIATIVILIFICTLPVVFAATPQTGNQNQTGATIREAVTNTVQNKGTESAIKVNEQIRQRLEGVKLKACQAKSSAIRTRSENLIRHMTEQVEVFAKIANRVDTYYKTNMGTGEYKLQNYQELITDLNENKEAIKPLLEKAKESAQNFNCEGEGPVGQLNQFREQTKEAIQAMQVYKASVRNLVTTILSLLNEGTPSATVTTTSP